VRETLASTRRPEGVDSFSLAVAAHGRDGSREAFRTLPLFKPSELDRQGPVDAALRETLTAWAEAGLLRPGARIAAVLFSWGDFTEELLAIEAQ
jgi:hypothetical protein